MSAQESTGPHHKICMAIGEVRRGRPTGFGRIQQYIPPLLMRFLALWLPVAACEASHFRCINHPPNFGWPLKTAAAGVG